MAMSTVPHRKWLLAALVAANLLFAAVLSIALWNSHQQNEALQTRTGQNLALVIERTVSGSFDKIDFALQNIADALEKQQRGKPDPQAIAELIEHTTRRLPEIEVLRYSDAHGLAAANSGHPVGAGAISIDDRDYFQTLKTAPNAGMVTSKPVKGKISNKWVIIFARSITGPRGEFAGVIFASVSLSYFTDIFQRLQIGQHGAVTLLDPDFAIIARYPAPSDPAVLGRRIPQEDLIALMKSDQHSFTRVFRTHVDAIKRSFSFYRLATRPYHVAVGFSSEDLDATWAREIALAGAVFLCFLGLTAFGAFQLRRSWEAQNEASEQIVREKDRYRELNHKLEARVEQRTNDLLKANRELKQAFEHLGNSEKLAALGSVVAGVAHELNTPIGNLKLAGSSFKERIAELSSQLDNGQLRRSALTEFVADAETFVRLLDGSVERASDLISSFKTLSVDQSSNRRRSFDLHQVIDDVLLTMNPKIKRKKCQVINAVPPHIVLDSFPGALSQIISNLLDNALLHAFDERPSGTVKIEVLADTEDELLLRFSDDGKGISVDDAERIFEPFYSTKIGAGGSGLGLHLVRQLALNPIGGSLMLDHDTTVGAAFLLRLPRRAPETDAA